MVLLSCKSAVSKGRGLLFPPSVTCSLQAKAAFSYVGLPRAFAHPSRGCSRSPPAPAAAALPPHPAVGGYTVNFAQKGFLIHAEQRGSRELGLATHNACGDTGEASRLH